MNVTQYAYENYDPLNFKRRQIYAPPPPLPAGNADPRVREALEIVNSTITEAKECAERDTEAWPIVTWLEGVAERIAALPSPQSQGLVEAAEWHEEQQRLYEEKRLNPRSRETGMSGDYWTIARAHKRSAEYFRSRASDRSVK